MENMKYYEIGRDVPKDAKKPIEAGRMKGKTNINCQWRIEKLTEMFGMVGFGWKTKTTKKEIIEGANGEKACFVDIELYVKVDGEWSEPIEGSGGSAFVTMEQKGLYTSDECFKKAFSDALSVACKAIGIGANVYRDVDESKYAFTGSGNGNSKKKQSTTPQNTTPSTTTPTTNEVEEKEKEVLQKVKDILFKAAGESRSKALKLLEEITSFESNGKTVKATSFDKLKGKWLMKTYGKLQEQYPDIYKEVKAKFEEEKKKAS